MPEVQTSTESGATTPVFIQFVMMQQQQALLALGRHPNAPQNAPPKNLTLGKVFIDQLAMIREKTAGNLNASEQQILASALASLQLAYVEARKPEQS